MSKKPKSGSPQGHPAAGKARQPYVSERPDGVQAPAAHGAQQREAVEPQEVLGRHRNSGPKDHKGAR